MVMSWKKKIVVLKKLDNNDIKIVTNFLKKKITPSDKMVHY